MSCLIIVTVIVSWFYAMIWSILPFFGPHQYVTEGFQTSCSFDYISQDYYTRSILMIMTVFGFIIPVIIITISYSMITKSIQKHYNSLNMDASKMEMTELKYEQFLNNENGQSSNTKNKLELNLKVASVKLKKDIYSEQKEDKKEENILMINTSVLCELSSLNELKANNLMKKKLFFKKEIQVTKFTILIIISFCASWLPYTILAVIGQFSPNRETLVTPYTAYGATLFAKSSTLFNPILYLILKQRCKLKFYFEFLTKK
jgi:hypothetical protein